jgi:ferrous iron transport protein B
MNSEIKSKKWLFGGIGLQFSVGYTVGFLVFFFGTLFTGGSFGEVWMPILGWAIEAVIVAIFTVLIIKKDKEMKAEAAQKTAAKKANI